MSVVSPGRRSRTRGELTPSHVHIERYLALRIKHRLKYLAVSELAAGCLYRRYAARDEGYGASWGARDLT
jgi:hypothetical protein